MEDPEKHLAALDIEVPCAMDPGRSAIVDATHRSYVNWEIYFFSSMEHKRTFDSNPRRYCGRVTDPVTGKRFEPVADSPRLDYNGRPYFFAESASLAVFEARPDTLAQPNYPMKKMKPVDG